ncbi:hypothetical protein IM40_10255 (plasmid) [Candidatus Paracaedimonas acanthamoebae]|nr:hypothetical protein IM40_10255 [Candidatus Paracaedimonas acanthamoebae]
MKINNKLVYASLVLGAGFGKNCFSCPQEIPFTALTANPVLNTMHNQHYLFQPITVGGILYNNTEVRFTDKDKTNNGLGNVVTKTSVLTIPKAEENNKACTYKKNWGDQRHNDYDIMVILHKDYE